VIGFRAGGMTAALALLAWGCDERGTVPQPTTDRPVEVPSPASTAPLPEKRPPSTETSHAGPHDTALIRREWRKADNREQCAPLAFASLGGTAATARRANFGGGWGVAYDLADQRSAFGLAGSGLLDEDAEPIAEQRARLARQWPLFRDLDHLPAPSFAGYGLEGAEPYGSEDPDGAGRNSLAYLRIGGQTCTYNVWSRLGRKHLEHLLEHLTVISQ
jgi:hypothetical protein